MLAITNTVTEVKDVWDALTTVYAVRERLDKSYSEIADHTTISDSTVRLFFTGDTPDGHTPLPKLDTFFEICKALGITIKLEY